MSALILFVIYNYDNIYGQFLSISLIIAYLLAPVLLLNFNERLILWLVSVGAMSGILPKLSIGSINSTIFQLRSFVIDDSDTITVSAFLLAGMLSLLEIIKEKKFSYKSNSTGDITGNNNTINQN